MEIGLSWARYAMFVYYKELLRLNIECIENGTNIGWARSLPAVPDSGACMHSFRELQTAWSLVAPHVRTASSGWLEQKAGRSLLPPESSRSAKRRRRGSGDFLRRQLEQSGDEEALGGEGEPPRPQRQSSSTAPPAPVAGVLITVHDVEPSVPVRLT